MQSPTWGPLHQMQTDSEGVACTAADIDLFPYKTLEGTAHAGI